MPILDHSFVPALLHRSGDLSTIITGVFRSSKHRFSSRERVTLSDGDFIDLDWYTKKENTELIVVVHGLEGSSDSGYILGMLELGIETNYDVVAINLRGCSGTPNLLQRSYHSGATEDLDEIVSHVTKLPKYSSIYLVGYSLGANLVLKYLGEKKDDVPQKVKKGIAVSVPADLKDAALTITNSRNYIYHQRFMIRLMKKMKIKQKMFSDFNYNEVFEIKNLIDFDHKYTAPAHGFEDAWDYYRKCSSLQFTDHIKTPTLILNAINDPFFTEKCIPFEQAKANQNLYLITPEYGGHVGFKTEKGNYFSEQITHLFLSNQLL